MACYQWMCTITHFEGFVQNQPVFHSLAMLLLLRKTWWPLFRFFRQNVTFWLVEAAGLLAAWSPLQPVSYTRRLCQSVKRAVFCLLSNWQSAQNDVHLWQVLPDFLFNDSCSCLQRLYASLDYIRRIGIRLELFCAQREGFSFLHAYFL